jgi:hypothetical protein
MASRDARDSMLSAHRAFVVHLGAGGGPGRRRFSGRVEHLSSGESIRFTSLRGCSVRRRRAGARPRPNARWAGSPR